MKYEDIYKINLHGYTVDKALEQFIANYNLCIQNTKGIEICVIHGYGSTGEGGKIRSSLRKYLSQQTDKLQWFSGEQINGNAGITYIKPGQALPGPYENLAHEILHFCQTPKTKKKIAGHFRKHGDQCTLQAIKYLEKNNQLKIVWKGKHKCYQQKIKEKNSNDK